MAKREPTYEVEYIPSASSAINEKSTWFVSKCDSREQAMGLEKSFHSAGWVARIAVVKTDRSFLG